MREHESFGNASPALPPEPVGTLAHVRVEERSWGVVVLAAGSSQRMGQPKLLLPWSGTSVAGHLLSVWNQVGAAQVAVVVAAGDTRLPAELERLGFPEGDRIVNPASERGMFSSIQCAARWPGWRSGLSHWLISLGDQPHLSQATLTGLVEFGLRHAENICQPCRHGRARHPVWFPKRAFLRLADSTASTLKEFLERHSAERQFWESADPGLDLDMDTPADYERLRARARS